jgi:hypothetical protein
LESGLPISSILSHYRSEFVPIHTTRSAQGRLRLLPKDYGSAEGRDKPNQTKKPKTKKDPFWREYPRRPLHALLDSLWFYSFTSPLRIEEAQNTLVWVMGSDNYQTM